MTTTGVGKLIRFPVERTEKAVLIRNLREQEEEIRMCLDDIENVNEHIVELTAEYEMLLDRLCELSNIEYGEIDDKG